MLQRCCVSDDNPAAEAETQVAPWVLFHPLLPIVHACAVTVCITLLACVCLSATCRAASGACDLAEYCTGTDASCPPDTKADDGTSCYK